jgi:pimeloyl-ACP methyl ester carboxylesterase
MTRLDFIPGTLCDERVWSRLTPLLGDGFNYNFVPLYKARSRLQMQELIAAHSAPASHLVAFSLGAYLAIEHALAHPERVESLVLIANSAKGLEPAEVQARERIVTMLERNAYAGMSNARLRELLHETHLNDQSIVGTIQDMALDLGKEVLMAQFSSSIDRPDLMDRLPQLNCPVLIVGAADDRIVNSADLREMAARIRHAGVDILDGGTGHMIPLEAPQTLADDMLDFYRKIG